MKHSNGHKVIVVVGTRPEAIKLAPVIIEMKKRGINVFVCSTGQHKEMVKSILTFFGIHIDRELELEPTGGNLNSLVSQVVLKFDLLFKEQKPKFVLVQGDTSSAFAAALASYHLNIPIGHVEAGLRTFNKNSPWPEEGNRAMLSTIADLHFAPTINNRQNLLQAGIPDESVFVTGNTVIDALLLASKKIDKKNSKRKQADERIVLITSHRRENLDINLENILLAVTDLAKKYTDVRFVFPMHPNPIIRKAAEKVIGKKYKNIDLLEPYNYPEFVALMKKSYFIITDSGGIQEEAPSLGKPVLIARDTTERPEGVEAGVSILVGTDRDKIFNAADELLSHSEKHKSISKIDNPYGDGKSSVKIVNLLKKKL